MAFKRKEERKICCVCGKRKSKTWTAVKGCNACCGHCQLFLAEQALGVCAFHKGAVHSKDAG